jgi:small-conductance mechanosensitive channel
MKLFDTHVKPFLYRLLLAAVVMFVFWEIAMFYKRKVLAALTAVRVPSSSPGVPNTVGPPTKTTLVYYELSNLLYYVFIIIGAAISFSILGVSNTAIFTVFGALGLAMSLAMQGYLSAVVSGIEISLNNWYSIGDTLKIVSGGSQLPTIQGEVIDFNLLRTVFLIPSTSAEGAEDVVSIPNDVITKSAIYLNQNSLPINMK